MILVLVFDGAHFQAPKVPLDGMHQLGAKGRHVGLLTHPVEHFDQTDIKGKGGGGEGRCGEDGREKEREEERGVGGGGGGGAQ